MSCCWDIYVLSDMTLVHRKWPQLLQIAKNRCWAASAMGLSPGHICPLFGTYMSFVWDIYVISFYVLLCPFMGHICLLHFFVIFLGRVARVG